MEKYKINACVFKFRVISIMSFTTSISGNSSNLITSYSPPLQLDGDYECGLLYFSTFNSIPNIDSTNNKFYYDDNHVLEIPVGVYELQDLCEYIKINITNCKFTLTCNNNTLKTNIFCSKDIHFEKECSIGTILGFDKTVLQRNILHESQLPVNILSTTVIRIECDIVYGSYINGTPGHIIHEFAPTVPPGYRIIEVPKNIIYFPITQESISSISIRILDSKNNLVNLRGEEILLYLHIKKK